MDSTRFLIVNADDFGLSEGVNRGIIEAHERGIVTSASLMVLKPAAASAAAYSREHPRLSLGLHLDLGEWAYDGEAWVPVYEVVPLDDPAVVAAGTGASTGRLSPTGRSRSDPPRFAPTCPSGRAGPVGRRRARPQARRPTEALQPGIQYCGRFYGQTARGLPLPEAITVESLIAILTDLPPGLTELGCHPGRGSGAESPYGAERSTEVDVLSDPRVRTSPGAEGIELRSFRDVIRQ